MTYEYEVPFELTFNLESEVMNNLIVHDYSVQEEIVISDTTVKYVLEDGVFIELEYLTTIEPFPEKEKRKILEKESSAIFEDSEKINTLITSNKVFRLVMETKVEPNDLENSLIEFSTAYITFI